MRRFTWFLLVLFLGLPAFAAQTTVSFDAFLPNPDEYIEDSSLADEAATFVNTYYESWGSWYWAGFAFSTVSNTTDGTWQNQYAAAQARTNAYAVGYDDGWHAAPEILFDLPAAPQALLLNNTTYAALTIRDGSAFSEPFSEGDYFFLTLTAYDLEGNIVAATNHYLADFRGTNRLIQTNWTELDLSWMPPEVVALAGALTTSDVGAFGPNTPMYFALADFTYAYAGPDSGLAATNPAFLCWASEVVAYVPGPNVSNQFAVATNALGPATPPEGPNLSTSLGDSGTLTLAFPVPITDGPGADFAVFENAFTEDFLELAYVEVSSDGTTFVRFPNHTLLAEPIDRFAETNQTEASAYAGLAGKTTQGCGTPFDLRVLAGTPGLDVTRVTRVRLVDIPGDGSALDSYGNPIYDPYPTVGSGGFDLDAVGVLNPLIQIAVATNVPAPEIPGFTTLLEYTPTLMPAAWTTNAPAQRTNGFYRYRLVP